jgi:hypothetical protein
MNKNERTWLIVAIVTAVAILAALWAASTFSFPVFPWEPWEPREHHLPPPYTNPEDIEFFYTAEAVVSTVNVTLSIILLITYVSIYMKTKSEFTIGLTIFSAVLLLHALASNPLLRWSFGYLPIGLGPFALLPDLFTFGALVVLLYLSIKY